MQPTPESDDRLPWGPKLSRREQMVLARLTGAADLWLVDGLAGEPDEARDAALSAFGATPAVWGVLLGRALRRVERGESAYAQVVEWCRRVGADEQAAGQHLAWLRHQPGV